MIWKRKSLEGMENLGLERACAKRFDLRFDNMVSKIFMNDLRRS
jgi:hypothetical protein